MLKIISINELASKEKRKIVKKKLDLKEACF